jgi:ELWxxDGT repeat protein
MITLFGRQFRKARRKSRPRAARPSSCRVSLQAEPLEDRLLLSLSPKLLLDINPGSAGSNPYGFTQVNNLIFFDASDNGQSAELWATNGAAAGTSLVADINNDSI